MIEQIFAELTMGLSGGFLLALTAAFGWGVLSILLSPCHLSSIPLIIGYISSQGQSKIKQSFLLALVFAIGILITIAAIGLITASMGRLMGDVGRWSNWLVGAVFLVIGLYLMDIISWNWNGVESGTKRLSGLWGALALGLIFGIGLGPCTFAYLAPVLAIVFQTAAESWFQAVMLISAFGVGHCTVIVLAGTLSKKVQIYLNWSDQSNAVLWVKRTCGFFIILGAVYFLFII